MNNFIKKTSIARNVTEGKKVVIIDPKNEYSKLAEMLGGEVITIDPNNLSSINPFELENDDNKNIEQIIDTMKLVVDVNKTLRGIQVKISHK